MKTLTKKLSEVFKPFRPLRPDFMANRWMLAMGVMALFLVDALQLLIPLVIKSAIDLLTLKTATVRILVLHGIAILCIALTMGGFRYLWRYCIFGHSRILERNLRSRLYSHLQTLSMGFYHRNKTGDLMSRAINDVNAVRMAAGMGLVALTDGMVLGLAAIGFMVAIDVRLTLIALIPAPVIVVLTTVLTRRMSAGFENVQKTFSDLTERAREAFAGIRVIKTYNREDWALDRIRTEGDHLIAQNMQLARTLAFFFPMMGVFTNVGLAIVLWLGGRLTILERITTGDFVAFTSYLTLLAWPMMAMGWVANLIQRGSASMRRINRVMEEVPEIRDIPGAEPLGRVQGRIEFRGLCLMHPGQREECLEDIRFTIEEGQTLALVGRVGCGKTSLLHTLARLIDVPPRAVFLDGRDIRTIRLHDLRANIGFVTQESFIFSDTVRENVLFGRVGIPAPQIELALETAGILEEVMALEKGLDTLLGERGVTLSGGQRQRLTIARALLQDPPILILDDALSMVDTRTEELILNRIFASRPGRTTLIVSHRISTIRRADRIVVLEAGRLEEMGTHPELMEKGGLYAKLYEKQLLAQELEDNGA
jgi:ATP-binding cassette subfamily B protein